jgi:hypothetical protein
VQDPLRDVATKNIRLKLDGDATVGQPLSVKDKASNADRIPHVPRLGNRSSYEDDEEDESKTYKKMLDEAMDRRTWLLDMIKSSAAEINLPFQNHWINNAIRGEDIPLALSILQAPDLERIWFRLPHTYLKSKWVCFLSTAIAYSTYGKSPDGVPRFERLTVIHIDLSRSGVQWPVSDALPILLLPSLADLTLGRRGTR